MKLIVSGLLLAGSLMVVAQQPPVKPEDRLKMMQRETLLLDRPIGTPVPAPPQASYKADSVKTEGSLVRLSGNVRIATPMFILTADTAEYRPSTGEIEPHGNVKVRLIQPVARKYKLVQ